ncbi:MAG: hypothetical protein CSB28_01865, partial [Desulfobacterales bacterium]
MGEMVFDKQPGAGIGRSANMAQVEKQPSLIDWKTIGKPLGLIAGVFLLFYWLPVDHGRFSNAVLESLALTKWYAREHVLLCLVP